MPGSEEDRTGTDWRTESRFYRRKPTINPSASLTAPAAPSASTSGASPSVGSAPMSIVRNGSGLTLTGELSDTDSKKSLLDSLTLVAPGANIVDQLTISPGVKVPDMAGLGGLFGAMGAIPDFKLTLDSDTLRLRGNGFSLAGNSQQLVRQIADSLKACPEARVTVVGYTDNTGSDAINVTLSGSRAKSVADGLVSDGVAADRVISRGEGAANPTADNDTVQGRAQNRRVEITVS